MRTVKLGARGFMVTRQDHVGNLESDVVEPLLPQIPVGLIQHAHITTLRATLVGDFARGQGLLVLLWQRATAGKCRTGAVVADRPVVGTSKYTRVPVIGVTEVTSVPGECSSFSGSLDQLLVCAMSIGVSHIIQYSDAERTRVTGRTASLEAEDLRLGGAIGGRDLVVVGGVGLQTVNAHLVEELTALGDRLDLGAGRSTVVSKPVSTQPYQLVVIYIRVGVALRSTVQVARVLTPADSRQLAQTEGGLVVNVHALGDVGQGNHIDIVPGIGGGRLDGRRFNQTREAFAVAIDGGIDPIADRDGRSSVGETLIDHRTGLGGRRGESDEQSRSSSSLHGRVLSAGQADENSWLMGRQPWGRPTGLYPPRPTCLSAGRDSKRSEARDHTCR